MTDDHGNHGISTADLRMHTAYSSKNLVCRQLGAFGFVQLIREGIQQDFGIRGGIDVTAGLSGLQFPQFLGISQVTIVCQCDTKWRVNIKRLSFCGTGATGRRITYMADTDIAFQTLHVTCFEHIFNKTIGFTLLERVIADSHDPCGVLAAVL